MKEGGHETTQSYGRKVEGVMSVSLKGFDLSWRGGLPQGQASMTV